MDDEVYSFALKNTIDEVKKVCPDISNAFFFKQDGEIIARDGNTSEETVVRAIDALDGLLEKAETIDGIENILFEGNEGRVHISHLNDLYFVNVTSKNGDAKNADAVANVVVPTVLKVLEKIVPTSINSNLHEIETETESVEPTVEKKPEETEEKSVEKTEADKQKERSEGKAEQERVLPEAPVNQFIVENAGGLLAPKDTVRIDSDILVKWEELYDDRKIEEAYIETFGGKLTRSKLKAIKDSKYVGKGIIQIPEKIQNALEIKKGELVRVKPVIE